MKNYLLLLFLSMLWMNVSAQAKPDKIYVDTTPLESKGIFGESPAKTSVTMIPIPLEEYHGKWYVGDNTAQYNISFADINAAMKSSYVQEGDTLFICMKSGSQMTAQTVSKKVVVKGFGYTTTATTQPLTSVFMNAEGAEIMQVGMSQLYINNNNIKVNNCYMTNVFGNKTSNENDNCTIHGCFVKGYILGLGTYGTDGWTFTNNIIYGGDGIENFDGATINHNTIVSPIALERITSSTVTNNVLYTYVSLTDCKAQYNIYGNYGELNSDNKLCMTLNDAILCKGEITSEDYYRPTGASLKYSTDGTDCGAFGGEDPYLPSGVKQEVVYVDKAPLEKRLAQIDTKIAELEERLESLSSKLADFKASYTNSTRIPAADKELFNNYYNQGEALIKEVAVMLKNSADQRIAIVLPENITQTQYDDFAKQIAEVEDNLCMIESRIAYYNEEATEYQTKLNDYLASLPRYKWYVGDKITDYAIDFTDINAAMSSSDVLAGDTLFVAMKEGSQMGYTDTGRTQQKVTKAVVITGSGFSTTATIQPIYALHINVEGVKVMKLSMEYLTIGGNNTTVNNCYVNSLGSSYNAASNCTIHGCFIKGYISGSGNKSWTLTNNILVGSSQSFISSTINHNTFISTNITPPLFEVQNSEILNNILYYPTGVTQSCGLIDVSLSKNIFNVKLSDIDNVTGNTINETLSKVIYAKGEVTDEMYYYPVGISLNYSTDGTDCGAFGGEDPYLLGGTKKATPTPEPSDEIEPNDLLALQNLYDRYNGKNWTTYKWNVAGKTPADYPGVSCTMVDNYYRVQEISIPSNNLSGSVTDWTVHLPYLTLLNLQGNTLYGDITQFLSELSKLKTLDISHNYLSGLTKLPSSVASLDKGHQNVTIDGGLSSTIMAKLYGEGPELYISDEDSWPNYYTYTQQMLSKYTIIAYDLTKNTVNYQKYAMAYAGSDHYMHLLNKNTPVSMSSGYTYSTEWASSPFVYYFAQDYNMYVVSSDNSYFPAVMKYTDGDANMDGKLSVLDVQTEINYILVPNNVPLYNYTAANTYNDQLMNVQDVVCTVNLLLTPTASATHDPLYSKSSTAGDITWNLPAEAKANVDADGSLYTTGNSVRLASNKEASAFDIELNGVKTDEVGLMLNRKDFQMTGRNTDNGCHVVIYSLSGKTIPQGDTQILSLSNGNASIQTATVATPEAKALNVSIENDVTGISNVNVNANHGTQKFIQNGRLVIKTAKGTYSAGGQEIGK